MWGEHHPRWLLFAGEVVIAAREIEERRMAAEVKGLAETVRQAKQAIARASSVAQRVNNSAASLASTMQRVEDMTVELDKANAELTGALGTITNGGPPLDDGGSEQLTLDQALNVVTEANSR